MEVYREIDVYIDGMLAAFSFPFPVMYSGGANPFLYQPIAGITSFNLPSTRLDLTPFLGLLKDGKEHLLEVSLYLYTLIPLYPHTLIPLYPHTLIRYTLYAIRYHRYELDNNAKLLEIERQLRRKAEDKCTAAETKCIQYEASLADSEKRRTQVRQ